MLDLFFKELIAFRKEIKDKRPRLFGNRQQIAPETTTRKQMVGKGNILGKTKDRANAITGRVTSRKRDIVPSVNEALSGVNVGRRISEFLPIKTNFAKQGAVEEPKRSGKKSTADISV